MTKQFEAEAPLEDEPLTVPLPPPVAEPPPAPAAPALPPHIAMLLDHWFVDAVHNRGLEVGAFNALRQSFVVLKETLAAALAEKDV